MLGTRDEQLRKMKLDLESARASSTAQMPSTHAGHSSASVKKVAEKDIDVISIHSDSSRAVSPEPSIVTHIQVRPTLLQRVSIDLCCLLQEKKRSADDLPGRSSVQSSLPPAKRLRIEASSHLVLRYS